VLFRSMVGIELVSDKDTKEPFPEHLQVGPAVTRAARRRGVVVRGLGDVVVLMPPLAITAEQLGRLVEGVAAAIEEVCRAPVGTG
jgi:adenosylmethionine-8-amino-7-oxononanoate aminotransferase